MLQEFARVVARQRAHRVDRAGLGVHGHERPGVAAAGLPERLLPRLLQPEVERELQLTAGARIARGYAAAPLARGVDLDAVGPVAPTQVAVVAGLEAVLADDGAGLDPLVVLLVLE